MNTALSEKVENAKRFIREAVQSAKRPAVMSSFGKDSMVLMQLIRDAVPRDKWSVHTFPMPVIYYRDPWFAHKHKFADSVIKSWGLEVHDYPPVAAGVKCKSDNLELVARYSLGLKYLDIPKNVAAPEEFPRRDYLCGLRDWLLRPKAGLITYPWDLVLMGHKSSDVDDFEGPVPLTSDRIKIHDTLDILYPLREWSDQDVWDYLEEFHVPIQKERYGVKAPEDKWHSNDYTHACTACIDPRSEAKEVFCPKLQHTVPNVGKQVLQIGELPSYIKRETPQLIEREGY